MSSFLLRRADRPAHLLSARRLWLALLAVLLLLPALPGHAAPAAASGVTLLLEDDQPDRGWNDLLKAGLQRAAQATGLPARVVTAPASADQQAIFREEAARSGLLIVACDNLHEVLRNNAANFRQTRFGCIDTGVRAANIMSITFADEQAAFLAGTAAAMMTTSATHGMNPQKTLGWLSAYETGAVRTMLNGFLEGARMVTPDMRIIHRVIGSWTDEDAARQAVQEMLDQGADIVVLSAGRAGLGTLDMLRQHGALAIGMDADQDALMPGTVLTSIRKRADLAVEELVRAYAENRFQGAEIITYSLANKGTDITGFSTFTASGQKVPARLKERCQELRMELGRGSIRLPSLRQGTLCNCR